MSLSHARGLRDALHKLRDTYYPPTADDVQLFTIALVTDEAQPVAPEPVRLRPEMPVPKPEFMPEPVSKPPTPKTASLEPRKTPKPYSVEEVETRW